MSVKKVRAVKKIKALVEVSTVMVGPHILHPRTALRPSGNSCLPHTVTNSQVTKVWYIGNLRGTLPLLGCKTPSLQGACAKVEGKK
jgi:hypothetical protein